MNGVITRGKLALHAGDEKVLQHSNAQQGNDDGSGWLQMFATLNSSIPGSYA
jgi:hypothetical protein